MASDQMAATGDSWNSGVNRQQPATAGSTGGFNEKMASTCDSWHSVGSWGSWGAHQATRLKQAVFTKSSNGADVTDKMLLDCFNELDRDRHGLVSPKELYKAFRRCGLKVSKAAMRSVMNDMGLDPTDEIDARDFIRFFRLAQELTRTIKKERPSRCSTKAIVCIVLLAIAASCVFLIMIVLDEEDRSLLRGIKFALIGCGCTIGVLVSYLLLVWCRGKFPRQLEACGTFCWYLILPRPPKAIDAKPQKVVVISQKKSAYASKVAVGRRAPAPIRDYRTVEVRPSEYAQEFRSPTQTSRVSITVPEFRSPTHTSRVSFASAPSTCASSYWQPPSSTGSHLATEHLPTKQYLRVNKPQPSVTSTSSFTEASSQYSVTSGPYNQHSGDSEHHRRQSRRLDKPLRSDEVVVPYDPRGYEEAKMMAEARHVKLNNGGLSFGSCSAVEVGTLPARPGAAKRNEEVIADVRLAMKNNGEMTPEQQELMVAARKALKKGDHGKPESYFRGSMET